MNRRGIIVIWGLAALLAGWGLAQNASANILVNPGFESGGLAPWFQGNDFGGSVNWFVTNTDAHTGLFSATDQGNKEIRQDFAAVPTSSITEISFWEKQPSAAISAYTFYYSDSTDGQFTVTPGIDWTFFDVTAQLAAGKNLVGFSVYGLIGPADDRTFLDDVTINSTLEDRYRVL